jgi:splicing factor U2AF subunit
MLAQQQALLAAMPVMSNPAAAMVAAAAAGGATLGTGGGAVDSTTARKSREVYIGNLAIGSVNPEMLTELFNAALAGMVSDPVLEPPVINVKMDNTGATISQAASPCLLAASWQCALLFRPPVLAWL